MDRRISRALNRRRFLTGVARWSALGAMSAASAILLSRRTDGEAATCLPTYCGKCVLVNGCTLPAAQEHRQRLRWNDAERSGPCQPKTTA